MAVGLYSLICGSKSAGGGNREINWRFPRQKPRLRPTNAREASALEKGVRILGKECKTSTIHGPRLALSETDRNYKQFCRTKTQPNLARCWLRSSKNERTYLGKI